MTLHIIKNRLVDTYNEQFYDAADTVEWYGATVSAADLALTEARGQRAAALRFAGHYEVGARLHDAEEAHYHALIVVNWLTDEPDGIFDAPKPVSGVSQEVYDAAWHRVQAAKRDVEAACDKSQPIIEAARDRIAAVVDPERQVIS